jgi:hypothetical protein
MPRQVNYCFTGFLRPFRTKRPIFVALCNCCIFMKRVTIVMSEELHQRLKIRCALRADTINSRLIKLIQADLNSNKD